MNRRNYSTLTDSEKYVFEQACAAVCRLCNDNFYGNTTRYGLAEQRVGAQWVHHTDGSPFQEELCDAISIRASFAQELA